MYGKDGIMRYTLWLSSKVIHIFNISKYRYSDIEITLLPLVRSPQLIYDYSNRNNKNVDDDDDDDDDTHRHFNCWSIQNVLQRLKTLVESPDSILRGMTPSSRVSTLEISLYSRGPDLTVISLIIANFPSGLLKATFQCYLLATRKFINFMAHDSEAFPIASRTITGWSCVTPHPLRRCLNNLGCIFHLLRSPCLIWSDEGAI